MKATLLAIIMAAMAAAPFTLANPADLPMGIQVFERDGVTTVREVPHSELGVEKRCRECKNLGEGCTIGDGSCKANQHGTCTWCGNFCKSVCVNSDGGTCEQWCL